MKPNKQTNWWKSGDVIKITATHWKTFLMGFRLGRILGFHSKEQIKSLQEKK